MDRKESANGLQLVKFGALRLKGKFSALFMGAFAMVTPLVLVVLVPLIMAILFEKLWILSIGIILFAVFVGPLQIGYIKYFNDTINGEQPKITRVYSQLKFSVQTLRIVYTSMLLLLMYIVGGILWIITAGFAVAFFSMTLFFVEKYKYTRLSQGLKECAKHMIGNRLALFSYKLIFYFVYLLLFLIAGLCMALVYTLAIDSLIISWIIALCSTIVFIFLYTMVTVYFHSCNQIFFEDTLMYNERKAEAKRLEKERRLARAKEQDNSNTTDIKEVVVKEKSKEKKTEKKVKKETRSKKENKKVQENK